MPRQYRWHPNTALSRAMARYIHLNPHAGEAGAKPRVFPAGVAIGRSLGEQDLPWLTADWLLGKLGSGLDTARSRIREQCNAATLTAVAVRFHHDLSTLSHAVSALEERSQNSNIFANTFNEHPYAIFQA
ncbi:MAG: hypothetical protein ABI619_06215 [Betaproteobacteria bacterium]